MLIIVFMVLTPRKWNMLKELLLRNSIGVI